jgi:hypothetical protein
VGPTRQPVEEPTDLRATGPVPEQHEPFVGREVEHVDQLTGDQQILLAGVGFHQDAPIGPIRVRVADRHHQPVAVARPRADERVVGVAGQPTPVRAVRPHHPHFGAHASARGHRGGDPLTVR